MVLVVRTDYTELPERRTKPESKPRHLARNYVCVLDPLSVYTTQSRCAPAALLFSHFFLFLLSLRSKRELIFYTTQSMCAPAALLPLISLPSFYV